MTAVPFVTTKGTSTALLARAALLVALGLLAATPPTPALAAPPEKAGARRGPTETMTLFVAASVEGPARVVARLFENRHAGIRVAVRAEASSRLAADVLAGGARPDVFLSADQATVTRLADAGFADLDTRLDLLGNALVVVAASEEEEAAQSKTPHPPALDSLADLAAPGAGAVALCDSLVPLGAYARALLRGAGAWEAVAERALWVTDARAALAAVEAGAAPHGIVYATQARISKKVRVVWSPEPGTGPEVRYSLVLLRHAARRPAARDLYAFLASATAGQIFTRYGFHFLAPSLPEAPGRK